MRRIDMPYYISGNGDLSFQYDKDPENGSVLHIEGIKITLLEFDKGEKLVIGESKKQTSFISSVPLDSSQEKVMFSRNP